jgi:hypothetical protein
MYQMWISLNFYEYPMDFFAILWLKITFTEMGEQAVLNPRAQQQMSIY